MDVIPSGIPSRTSLKETIPHPQAEILRPSAPTLDLRRQPEPLLDRAQLLLAGLGELRHLLLRPEERMHTKIIPTILLVGFKL